MVKRQPHIVRLILLTILFCCGQLLSAQISEGGMPRSYLADGIKGTAALPGYLMPEMDIDALLSYNETNPLPLRYAVIREVTIDIKSAGTSSSLPDGGRIWRYRITSPNGKSVQVIFRKYLVPDKAELYLYGKDYSSVRGAYTRQNITEDLLFVTGDLPGNDMIIEYYEPDNAEFSGEVIIGWIGQSYLDIFSGQSDNTDADGFIPVNCREGKDLQNQKHSVCKITFNDSKYSYLCSGAFINNTRNDATSYFLTANHCVNTAQEANSVVAWFNYEDDICSVVNTPPTQSLSGTSIMTMGEESDYTLLKFNHNVPKAYQPFYAGWSLDGTAPLNSASIHHPNGKKKKISIDFDPAQSNAEPVRWTDESVSPVNSHWVVTFDEGANSSGSSGSPLFDEEKRIRGQLHGGSEKDFFGKLSYSWTHPDPTYSMLSLFLDPDNTGVTTLEGYYPDGIGPDAKFISDFSAVCIDSPIEITGFSAFDPLSWQWSFNPADVTYHNGTGSASRTPVVSFDHLGSYSASLTVTNTFGADTQSIPGFITAGTSLLLETYMTGLGDSCARQFSSVNIKAYGADAYLWELSPLSDNTFYIENNTANPVVIKLINGVTLTRSRTIILTLTGAQGTCQESVQIRIPLQAQANDDIADAKEIFAGINGPFSNKCATIESGEPVPPHTSCTGQYSWCDEYGTGRDLVENSVWFLFTPATDQTITLASTGFDNQIALYTASSYQDILNGIYQLIAANDDRTDTDPFPIINPVGVTAGQKYWVQVDGSGGGLTGDFFLELSVQSSINAPVYYGGINVYPSPATETVTLESERFIGIDLLKVELFNSSGEIIYQMIFSQASGAIQLPLNDLKPGLYFARVYYDDRAETVRVIKK